MVEAGGSASDPGADLGKIVEVLMHLYSQMDELYAFRPKPFNEIMNSRLYQSQDCISVAVKVPIQKVSI